jgi:hypothetical protein
MAKRDKLKRNKTSSLPKPETKHTPSLHNDVSQITLKQLINNQVNCEKAKIEG